MLWAGSRLRGRSCDGAEKYVGGVMWRCSCDVVLQLGSALGCLYARAETMPSHQPSKAGSRRTPNLRTFTLNDTCQHPPVCPPRILGSAR